MGLWVQNVGVRDRALPASIARLADEQGYWLPDPPQAGWSWTSLREMHVLADLDGLTARAADAAAGPALAFSVHDEDSVYVVAAEADGVAARLVLDPDAFEEQGLGDARRFTSRAAAQAFAEWSGRHAPAEIDTAGVLELIGSGDIATLLVRVGLYPPFEREPLPWSPPDMTGVGPRDWDGGGHAVLLGPREFAILAEPPAPFEGPPGPWILLLAREALVPAATVPVQPILTSALEDTRWDLGGGGRQIGLLVGFGSIEEAKAHFGSSYLDRRIGEWQSVPESLDRSPAATIAWILSRLP